MVDIENKEAEVVIKNHVGGITNQSWSPDGQKILYGYKRAIISYNFSTKKTQKLVNGDWCGWSPNGNWIAYLDGNKINIINPNNLEKQMLVENGNISIPIYWLPNGEYILYGVFSSSHAEVGSPYVIRLRDKQIESMPVMIWALASWANSKVT